MPTRKQRRRSEKGRRHEYETVWVDDEGNELEEPPEEALADARGKRQDRPKGRPQRPQQQQQRGGRSVRVPQPPSWQRAGRRSVILGVVVFALFYAINTKSSRGHRLETAAFTAALYTALFIPFTYYMDRFMLNRYRRRTEQSGKGSATKR